MSTSGIGVRLNMSSRLLKWRPPTADADDVLRASLERGFARGARPRAHIAHGKALKRVRAPWRSFTTTIGEMPNGTEHCTPRAAERARRADGSGCELRRAQIQVCTGIWRNKRS